MARDSGGNFSLLSVLAPPGTVNNPTAINTIMTDIATALTDSINVLGTKPFAANQPMAGFKFTGMADGTAATDGASLGQAQKGNKNLATANAGTVDAIALTFSPPFTVLSTGMEIKWVSGGVNTITAPTIAIDAIGGTKIIKKGASAALAAGDLGVSGYINLAIYNGTDWIQQNPPSTAISLATNTDYLTGTDTAKAVTAASAYAQWGKGADIASAGTMTIGDGGYMHVTGTTTITDIDFTVATNGRPVVVVFDGVLTLTHNATTLILPGAANIVTAAGDTAAFVQDSGDNVKCVWYMRANGTSLVGGGVGSVVAVSNVLNTAGGTTSTALPSDDTIPQITEGSEFFTLSHTPQSTTNKLKIDVVLFAAGDSNTINYCAALFQDAISNALSATSFRPGANNGTGVLSFSYFMTAGTTSAITFRLRAGPGSGGFVMTINGAGGGRNFGGVAGSSMTVTEIKA